MILVFYDIVQNTFKFYFDIEEIYVCYVDKDNGYLCNYLSQRIKYSIDNKLFYQELNQYMFEEFIEKQSTD